MELPQIQVLSKTDLAKEKVPEMMQWSKDPLAYEDALSKLKSGTEYSFYSQLFRSLKRSSLSLGLYPVSSYTREGFIGLIGEFARIFGGGEEYEE